MKLTEALQRDQEAACRRRVYVDNCTTPGNVCVSGGVIISFSTAPGYDASQFTITREAHPTELEYKGGAASYIVTVTLNNGATVSHSGLLVRNTAREPLFTPFTPGYRVYAFVPTPLMDPSRQRPRHESGADLPESGCERSSSFLEP